MRSSFYFTYGARAECPKCGYNRFAGGPEIEVTDKITPAMRVTCASCGHVAKAKDAVAAGLKKVRIKKFEQE